MTLADWVAESRFKLREYGLRRGLRSSLLDFWAGAARRACHTLRLDRRGTPIYDREWDVLVIMDTCRVDALEEVIADGADHDFLPASGSVPAETSVGSTSWEWLYRNFGPDYREEVARTAYVTGNAHTKRFGGEFPTEPGAFELLDEVWEYAWDEDFGGMPPRPVTDRAVSVGRELDPDRLIVHYMQPHTPYRNLQFYDDERELGELDRTVWDLLQIGDLSRAEAWDAYLDNLEWVLDEVELLLANLDADRVVLTSDHGEAFGEWGLYGHVRHVPIEALRTVPWVETSARDTGEYEPELSPESVELSGDDVDERLAALGYR